jgi:hypothetical protein
MSASCLRGPGSNLEPEIDYVDRSFLWIPSLPQGKCCDSDLESHYHCRLCNL